MLNFPIRTIDYIKKLLIRQQKEVEKNLKEVKSTDPAKSDGLAEASEPGTDSYIADSHTKTVVLENQLKKVSGSIKDALSKISNGTYGKCDSCRKRIEMGRLLVMPMTQYCLSCSKKNSI